MPGGINVETLSDPAVNNSDCLSERRSRQILESFLVTGGWKPEAAWSRGQGLSVEAGYGAKRWIIQLGVMKPSKQRAIDVFSSVLGEILRRMNDPLCSYSIALPDTETFHRLWDRLPDLAKNRLELTALFINSTGIVLEKAS